MTVPSLVTHRVPIRGADIGNSLGVARSPDCDSCASMPVSRTKEDGRSVARSPDSSDYNKSQNRFVVTVTLDEVRALGGGESNAVTNRVIGTVKREGYCPQGQAACSANGARQPGQVNGCVTFICHKAALCTGLAAAARIDHSEKHRSPTRNTPQPRAFRGTDAKEFPILKNGAEGGNDIVQT